MYCPKCDGEFDSQIHRVYHATIRQHGRIAKTARKADLEQLDRHKMRATDCYSSWPLATSHTSSADNYWQWHEQSFAIRTS